MHINLSQTFIVLFLTLKMILLRNSYEERFKSGTPLKFSSRWDTVQACCVADIDMDGRAEIILGTFGQV